MVVSNDLHNVPDNALYGVIYSTPGNAGMETWFFGHPHDSAGAIADAENSIVHPTHRPGSSAIHVSAAGTTISWLIFIGLTLFVILIGVRHHFVGRRLLIMIPTMLIIFGLLSSRSSSFRRAIL